MNSLVFCRRPTGSVARVGGLTAIGLALATGAAYSQQSQTVQTSVVGTPTPAAGKTRPVHFEGDSTSQTQTPVGEIVKLAGHAKIQSDDTTLLSEVVTYNRLSNVATAPNKVTINDTKNTVIGNSGVAHYTTRDAVITGAVHITIHPSDEDVNAPEGSARRDFKNPVNIYCDRVDYNWRTKVAIATGHLTITMEGDDHGGERKVTADKATYYGDTRDKATNDAEQKGEDGKKVERIVLDGNVHYTRPNGEHGDSNTAVAILKKGHESYTASGTVSGVVMIDDTDEDKTTDSKSGAGTAKPEAPTTPGTSKTPGTSTSPVVPAPAPSSAPATPVTAPGSPASPTTPKAPATSGG